jgi:hypothetical protein
VTDSFISAGVPSSLGLPNAHALNVRVLILAQAVFSERRTRQLKERKEEEFFTPYAPAVLTLRGPSAAISLG